MYKVTTALTNWETNNTHQLSFIQVARLDWIVHVAISVGTFVNRVHWSTDGVRYGMSVYEHRIFEIVYYWYGTCLWNIYISQLIRHSSSTCIWSIYISQLIRYARACGSYQDFLDRGLLLTRKLLNQGFLFVKLKSSLRKFYGPHHDLVDRYGIYVSRMTTDMFHLS